MRKLLSRNECKQSLSLKNVLLWEKTNFEIRPNFNQNNSNRLLFDYYLTIIDNRETKQRTS